MSGTVIAETISYYPGLEKELEKLLSVFSSVSRIGDHTFYLDLAKKRASESNSKYTGYFSNIPVASRHLIQYYVLLQIMEKNVGIKTALVSPIRLTSFFTFLNEIDVSLGDVNRKTIELYIQYLASNDEIIYNTKSRTYNDVAQFFKKMSGWPSFPHQNPLPSENPFPQKRTNKKNPEKLIPDFVVHQIDDIMYGDLLPLERRSAYWTMRLYPNRPGEICSMTIDCLKDSFQADHKKLVIPEFKQSGDYKDGQDRLPTVKKEGMGKFLIDLIEKQQEASRALQATLPSNQQGYLFTYMPRQKNNLANRRKRELLTKIKTTIEKMRANDTPERTLSAIYKEDYYDPCYFNKKYVKEFLKIINYGTGLPKIIDQKIIDNFFPFELRLIPNSAPVILTPHTLFKWVCQVIEEFGIKGEDGKTFRISPYKFRHNAITDRKEDGFTSLQVRSLTGHAGTAMIDQTYDHSTDQRFEKTATSVRETVGGPVLSKGRILNMDEKTEAVLLTNVQAQRIGKIGICRDITRCQSGLFLCLGCEYLIPDCDQEDYFRDQLLEFQKKEATALARGHKALAENAHKNASLHAAIIAKIESAKTTSKQVSKGV